VGTLIIQHPWKEPTVGRHPNPEAAVVVADAEQSAG